MSARLRRYRRKGRGGSGAQAEQPPSAGADGQPGGAGAAQWTLQLDAFTAGESLVDEECTPTPELPGPTTFSAPLPPGFEALLDEGSTAGGSLDSAALGQLPHHQSAAVADISSAAVPEPSAMELKSLSSAQLLPHAELDEAAALETAETDLGAEPPAPPANGGDDDDHNGSSHGEEEGQEDEDEEPTTSDESEAGSESEDHGLLEGESPVTKHPAINVTGADRRQRFSKRHFLGVPLRQNKREPLLVSQPIDVGEWGDWDRRKSSLAFRSLDQLGVTSQQRQHNITYLVQNFGDETWGIVTFPNRSKATWVRLSPETAPDAMVQLVQKLGYSLPELVVNIEGGTKDYEMPAVLQQALRRGIRKAVEATDAWCITSGTHCGTAKSIGEALVDFREPREAERKMPLIGIAPWGVIAGKEELMSADASDIVINYTESGSTALDPNHNLFWLVDDGSQGQFGLGVDLANRFIDQVLGSSAAPIYSILIVVEGGSHTLDAVERAILSGRPAVVVDGSGRLSDLIAYAWRFLHDDSPKSRAYTRTFLRQKIRGTFPLPELDAIEQRLFNVVTVKSMVTIFSLEDAAHTNDVDDAMLAALMSRIRQQETGYEGLYKMHKEKLQLAKAFKRVDIAQRELHNLRDDVASIRQRNPELHGQLKSDFQALVHDNLIWAMVTNQIDFVRIFTPQVDRIALFLYKDKGARLKELYLPENNPQSNDYFPRLLETVPSRAGLSQLDRTDRLILNLLFTRKQPKVEPRDFAALCDLVATDHHRVAEIAFHDLLIWGALMGHHELTEFFWQQGGHSIPNALVASRLYFSMANSRTLTRHGHFRETVTRMTAMSDHFEDLAKGVLDECNLEDNDRAQRILRVKLEKFRLLRKPTGEHLDCIEIAVQAENRKFMSNAACQAVLEEEWYGGMDPESTEAAVIANAICPPLLLQTWVLAIQVSEALAMQAATEHDRLERHSTGGSTRSVAKADTPYSPRRRSALSRLGQRCATFYTAPITKFYLDAFFFVALLVLYSYVTLTPFETTLSVWELALFAWMGVMMLEELRQLITQGLLDWFASGWNRLDLFLYVVFCVALWARVEVLRSGRDGDRRLAKAVFSVNLTQLFLRSLRIYAVNSTLGPKLITLKKMQTDFVSFACIFSVFLLSYGIATQAILFPDGTVDGQTITNVLWRPYIQIFGELQIEEIIEDTDCIGPWPFNSCAPYQWLLPLYMALFLIIANIMLVNLLIAMFTRTYEEVELVSLETWRFQFHDLLIEYRSKPVLPAPLSVASLLVQALAWAVRKCRPTCRPRPDNPEIRLERELAADERNSKLERFQEKHTERYLERRKLQQIRSNSARIERLEMHVNGLRGLLSELHGQSQRLEDRQHFIKHNLSEAIQHGHRRATESPLSARRPSLPHPQALGRTKSKEGLLTPSVTTHALYRTEAGYATEQPSAPTLDFEGWSVHTSQAHGKIWYSLQDGGALTLALFECELETGSRARTTHLGEAVVRAPVPSDKIHWSTPFGDYQPLEYTAASVLLHGKGGPWHTPPDACRDADRYKFHTADPETPGKRKRPTLCGGYEVVHGRPRNPFGRTGLAGRGCLSKWGPNRAICQVVSRWKLNRNGLPVERKGRRVLEVVALRSAKGVWSIPVAFDASSKKLVPQLAQVFGAAKPSDDRHELRQDLRSLLKTATELYTGYTNDLRNTDNAWVELKAFSLHDQDGLLRKADLMASASPMEFMGWIVVHEHANVLPDHLALLKRVVDKTDAFY